MIGVGCGVLRQCQPAVLVLRCGTPGACHVASWAGCCCQDILTRWGGRRPGRAAATALLGSILPGPLIAALSLC